MKKKRIAIAICALLICSCATDNLSNISNNPSVQASSAQSINSTPMPTISSVSQNIPSSPINTPIEQNNGGSIVTNTTPKIEEISSLQELLKNDQFSITSSENYKAQPSISLSNNGNFIVTWLKIRDAKDKLDLFAKLYDKNGQVIKDEFKVNSQDIKVLDIDFSYTSKSITGSNNYPEISMDQDGNSLIIWRMNQGLYIRSINASGEFSSDEIKIADYDDVDSSYTVRALNNGKFVLSWKTDKGIKTAITDNKGKILYESETDNYLGRTDKMKIDVSNDGFWVYISSKAFKYSMFAQLNKQVYINNNGKNIFLDNNGNFIAAEAGFIDSPDDIYLVTYDSQGEKVGENIKVNNEKINIDRLKVQILYFKTGDFIVIWGNQADNTSEGEIYARRFNKNKIAKEDQFKISNSNLGFKSFPNSSSNINGDLVVTWKSFNDNQNKNDILIRKYNINGVIPNNIVKNEIETVNCSKPSTYSPTPSYIAELPDKDSPHAKELLKEYKERLEKIKNKPVYSGQIDISVKVGETYVNSKSINIPSTTYISEMKFSGASINNTGLSSFAVGAIIIKFNKSACKDKVLQLYNSKIVNSSSYYDMIALDLSKSPINRAESIIREYNKTLPEDITSIKFESIEAMQTFITYLDLVLEYGHLFDLIQLNGKIDPA